MNADEGQPTPAHVFDVIAKIADERAELWRAYHAERKQNRELRDECKRLRDAVTKLDGLFTDEGEFLETHVGQLEAALQASQAVLHGPTRTEEP